jgi:CheY-like chemotaxis protein
MDMRMPKMGGIEATREIRKFLPNLPIVALTAYVSPADENDAISAGCNEFLSKPVNRPKLLGLLKTVLGR